MSTIHEVDQELITVMSLYTQDIMPVVLAAGNTVGTDRSAFVGTILNAVVALKRPDTTGHLEDAQGFFDMNRPVMYRNVVNNLCRHMQDDIEQFRQIVLDAYE